MIARFIGGPHDGLELDQEAISRYCATQTFFTPDGLLTFVLMPPTEEDWERIVSGEIGKEDFEEPPVSYCQVHTVTGIEFHFDEGGRRWAEAMADPLAEEEPDPESKGRYYKCLRGDSEHLALTEPFSFAVHDAMGRNWICYPIAREDVEKLKLLDHVADVMAADAVLNKLGMSRQGTEVRVYFCQREAELREKLAENPRPRL
jgi:hypothetical protein